MRKEVKRMVQWNEKRLKNPNTKRKNYPFHKKDLRITTTEATIILNKLFKTNTTLFIAFLIYRLRMDLGFTVSEVCNFIGLTPKQVARFVGITQNLLYLKVFDILENEDIQKEILEFQRKKHGTGSVGWYNKRISKYRKKLGFVGVFYKVKKMGKWDFFHNNTYEHFKRWLGEWNKYISSSSSSEGAEGNTSGEESTKSPSEATQTQTVIGNEGDEGSRWGFDRNIVAQSNSEEISQVSTS
jgi:hypothetical protein